ncbi:conserved hypothetical protein of the DUF37 family [Candidatus Kinetoplastibacterium desouzaii TCC079E]|uniref:Putative membrane protein insertion efficiency factor n=1 Tax=Candidatus Kinetoplastidibacterium desouzai TCC079E TaxID=1208919 RepID=M1LNP8_9PROT|nr:membrane protein insertion efficiency factor YidD [Candidatus Kinetoplastibacterium desouzaii]AGF47302.1 conserved hypothetical protein of the DUF37 family [Candidatus Kinetoplastibacterium desouzaii TCC079E]
MYKNIAIVLIKLYQYLLSPLIGTQCRFTPSCSCYAIEAIKKHGMFSAVLLIVFRILRCNPLCSGGNDPVPSKQK